MKSLFICAVLLVAIANGQSMACPDKYDANLLPDFNNICINITELAGLDFGEVLDSAMQSGLDSVFDVGTTLENVGSVFEDIFIGLDDIFAELFKFNFTGVIDKSVESVQKNIASVTAVMSDTAMGPVQYAFCGLIIDFVFGCKTTGWSDDQKLDVKVLCVKGFRKVNKGQMKMSDQIALAAEIADAIFTIGELLADMENFDLASLSGDTIDPYINIAITMYRPSYGGFVCAYFAFNTGVMTESMETNCESQRAVSDLDVDLWNFLQMMEQIKNDVVAGSTAYLELMGCFGLSIE